MIARPRRARPRAGRAARSARGRARRARRLVRALGRAGLARRLAGDADPDGVACRPAGRVRRGRPPGRRHRRGDRPRRAAAGHPVRPASSSTRSASTRRRSSASSTTPARGTPSSTPSRRWPSHSPHEQCDDALLAISRFVDLKSPFTVGHSTAVAELAPPPARQLGLPDDEVRTAVPGRTGPRLRSSRCVELDLGQAGLTRRGRMGTSASAPVLHRADAPAVTDARTAGPDRGSASRAARRLRLPAGLAGSAISPHARRPGRGRRVSGHARAPAVPQPLDPPTKRRPSCGPTCEPGGSSPTRSRRCSLPPGIASCAAARDRPG